MPPSAYGGPIPPSRSASVRSRSTRADRPGAARAAAPPRHSRRAARHLPRRLLLNASERAEGRAQHGPFGRGPARTHQRRHCRIASQSRRETDSADALAVRPCATRQRVGGALAFPLFVVASRRRPFRKSLGAARLSVKQLTGRRGCPRPTYAFAAQIGWKSPCSWQLAHFRDLVDAATEVVGSVGDMRTDPAPAIEEALQMEGFSLERGEVRRR